MNIIFNKTLGVLTYREFIFGIVNETNTKNVIFSNKYFMPPLHSDEILIMDICHSIPLENEKPPLTMMTTYLKFNKEIEGEEVRAKVLCDHIKDKLEVMMEKKIDAPTHSIYFPTQGMSYSHAVNEGIHILTATFIVHLNS